MKKVLICLFIAQGLVVAAQAQAVRNAAEKSSDHQQIHVDQATIDRDRTEIQQFQGLHGKLDGAIANNNHGGAHMAHKMLVEAMEREIAQGENKIARSNKEVAGSKSEQHSDTREVRRDRAQGKPNQAADDRQDRRDDHRDLNDDRSDRSELVARNNRQKAILADFRSIQVSESNFPFAAIKAKHALLDEFQMTMQRDLDEDVEELREDHGELREDRRETREDRRQR